MPAYSPYAVAEHTVGLISTLGQKIQWMRDNPRVCVEVEDIADQFHWATVVIFGRYEEITEPSAESEACERAFTHFEQRPQWWLPAAAKLASGAEPESHVLYRIRIDRMTGRRAARSPRTGDGTHPAT